MELIGDGVRLLVENADDEEARPGLLIEISNEEQAQQASIVLEREDVEQLFDLLNDWLVDTEPDPDIPGRPL
jgi:hypothetical protein